MLRAASSPSEGFAHEDIPAPGCHRSVRARRCRARGVRPSREGRPGGPDQVRCDGQRGYLGHGLRRHGRVGRGREEGGRTERDRAAPGLGELRQDHQGVRRQVRHQGQLRAARRDEPGRDQRREPAEGQSRRRTCSTSASPWRWPTRRCSRRTRWRPSTTSRTRYKDANGAWVNDYGGYMSIGYDTAKVPDVDDGQRPAQAGVQRQGRTQR